MNDVYHVLDDVSFYVGSFFRDDTFVGVIELSIHLKRACKLSKLTKLSICS